MRLLFTTSLWILTSSFHPNAVWTLKAFTHCCFCHEYLHTEYYAATSNIIFFLFFEWSGAGSKATVSERVLLTLYMFILSTCDHSEKVTRRARRQTKVRCCHLEELLMNFMMWQNWQFDSQSQSVYGTNLFKPFIELVLQWSHIRIAAGMKSFNTKYLQAVFRFFLPRPRCVKAFSINQ